VRAEGLTERLGDILMDCSGSTPGAVFSGNLTVFLPVPITNRVDSNNQTLDAVLFVNYGSVDVPSATGLVTGGSIAFNGISFTVPSSGSLHFRISNIRAAVGTVAQVLANISSTSIPVSQSQVVIAYPRTSLFATLYGADIPCTGSPLASTTSLSALFAAGTVFASTRITGSFAGAFAARAAGDDTGTRFLIGYSGFPPNAHVYIPNMVAGSNALVPSIGGDMGPLGAAPTVGQYVPGSGTLLLVRVQGPDATGAGGIPLSTPSGFGPALLDSVSEVPLTGGAGYAVYEVADTNPNLMESAQFPTFVSVPGATVAAVAQEKLSYAPVSSVMSASMTAPVPRFLAGTGTPPSDCTVLGDCGASYFPKLSIDPTSIQLTAITGGAMTYGPGYIPIQNSGGGIMNWTAIVSYTTGSGWLTLDYTSGENNGSVRVWPVVPESLAAGTYQAKIIIDGGPLAGNATIPVTLTVQAAPVLPPTPTPTPTPPVVTVNAVVNAANFTVTPLVPGSLGTLFGANLSGKSVSVTFDGNAATLLYAGATQIDFQVPPSLASKTSSTLVVTVDGSSSAPQTVALAPVWPAIFAGGVLNQDNTGNKTGSAAKAGSILQIFATGIPTSATVSVQIADRKNLIPLYAGAAPGLTGVQQVNAAIPADLAGGATQLIVCATAGSTQACSAAYPVVIQ